uniref:Protein kinase domain-containing protein n=1 Tax=viral metagenome TaxID=1070528 RepID=A0A6C0IDB7_9ZZZZ
MSYINKILFVINVFSVISFEFVMYLLYNDYSIFIDRVCYDLANINILYVKIFQAFAYNNNLIDETTNNNLLKFTNKAPWKYSDIHFYNLIKVCEKYDIVIKTGFERPINSGMISLVFKGNRRGDNKDIIIKIKRVNIEKKLSQAIVNIQFFLDLLSYIPFIKNYNLDEVVNKNINNILEQTNFIKEVNNLKLIKNNCKNLEYVIIPEVFEEVTNNFPDVIMMEFINGIQINEIDKDDYQGFAQQIIKFGIVTSLIHGVTHGDLHSGNILFIKDNNDKNYKYKIGIIDFGIITIIEEKYRLSMFNIVIDFFSSQQNEIAKKILHSGIIEPLDTLNKLPISHYNHIYKIISELVQEVLSNSKTANQLQIYKFLITFNNYINSYKLGEFGLHINDEFRKIQLTIAMTHGVTITLCNGNFIDAADKVINDLLHTDLLLK